MMVIFGIRRSFPIFLLWFRQSSARFLPCERQEYLFDSRIYPQNPRGGVPMAAPRNGKWQAVHIMAPSPEDVPLLSTAIEKTLAPLGINALILEVNYSYEYRSHPELRMNGALSKGDIRDILTTCRKHRIRLIPQFNCLGHQSWDKTTFPLLVKYPEFDETPQIPLDNPTFTAVAGARSIRR
jgi:hypothetical protein